MSRLAELRDQLRRAALSVSNNIAEGFERGTTAELLSFLYIARGSAGEVRSMLLFCQRLAAEKSEISNSCSATRASQRSAASQSSKRYAEQSPQSQISNLKSQISDLISLAESCSRQIRAWADQLQNSDIPGQRRLTDKTRQAYKSQRSADDFLQQLQDIRDAARGKGES